MNDEQEFDIDRRATNDVLRDHIGILKSHIIFLRNEITFRDNEKTVKDDRKALFRVSVFAAVIGCILIAMAYGSFNPSIAEYIRGLF